MEGRKDDQGKRPWHLIPWATIGLVVDVLNFGQQKYSARNWEKGMDWDRPFSACIRHITAWYDGERCDQETGLPHLAHAICCLLFLLTYENTRTGLDNRPATVKALPDTDIPF